MGFLLVVSKLCEAGVLLGLDQQDLLLRALEMIHFLPLYLLAWCMGSPNPSPWDFLQL